jgi:hypothetical protein
MPSIWWVGVASAGPNRDQTAKRSASPRGVGPGGYRRKKNPGVNMAPGHRASNGPKGPCVYRSSQAPPDDTDEHEAQQAQQNGGVRARYRRAQSRDFPVCARWHDGSNRPRLSSKIPEPGAGADIELRRQSLGNSPRHVCTHSTHFHGRRVRSGRVGRLGCLGTCSGGRGGVRNDGAKAECVSCAYVTPVVIKEAGRGPTCARGADPTGTCRARGACLMKAYAWDCVVTTVCRNTAKTERGRALAHHRPCAQASRARLFSSQHRLGE